MSGRVGGLVLRGMIAGFFAGLLAAAFAAVFGEPSIERAITYEAADERAGRPSELVSRGVQQREGLLTAGAFYGAAIGSCFGLAFALAHGRTGRLGPEATTAALAIAGFVAIALVPALKYPPSPPATGDPATIGARTMFYFIFVLVSVGAMVIAVAARVALQKRFGAAAAGSASLALFVVLVTTAGLVLPAAEALPSGVPSDLVTSFRWASLATQAVLWGALGVGFALACRVPAPRSR
jgi:predicted cobalt transporter CbtA